MTTKNSRKGSYDLYPEIEKETVDRHFQFVYLYFIFLKGTVSMLRGQLEYDLLLINIYHFPIFAAILYYFHSSRNIFPENHHLISPKLSEMALLELLHLRHFCVFTFI